MLCYRDQTFCTAAKNCATMDCHCRLTEADGEKADALGLPVAWANFAPICSKFVLNENHSQ